MERLYDEPDPLRTFGLALMASVLGGGICLWLSKLTGGVPAVNYLTWFGFLACMAAAVMVAAAR